MSQESEGDFSLLAHPLIKSRADLKRIFGCVDFKNYKWPAGIYLPTSSIGLSWMLKSLAESVGIHPGLKFCDIGFGSGRILATFAVLGYKTYGVDMRRQPLEHAPGFFERVQNEFGRFSYQPQLLEAKIDPNTDRTLMFTDRTKIGEMDIYYCNTGDENRAPVLAMKYIAPKEGAIIIHHSDMFSTREKFESDARKYPFLYSEETHQVITYQDIGFRLLNQGRQDMKLFQQHQIGMMVRGTRPIFIKA